MKRLAGSIIIFFVDKIAHANIISVNKSWDKVIQIGQFTCLVWALNSKACSSMWLRFSFAPNNDSIHLTTTVWAGKIFEISSFLFSSNSWGMWSMAKLGLNKLSSDWKLWSKLLSSNLQVTNGADLKQNRKTLLLNFYYVWNHSEHSPYNWCNAMIKIFSSIKFKLKNLRPTNLREW